MPTDPDPYRILGLARGAPLADVKKAYRRLAKANHPDAAGEAALPRFLAIQAAYDQIAGPAAPGRPGTRPATPRRPWDADPDRADATRRAYGGRARRTRTGSGGPHQARGSADPAGGGGGGGSGGAGRGAGRGDAGGGAPPPPRPDGPPRPPNKATLGSTSYDGADAEPFEPDWGGASWYGTTSGTYWTLNPKEYADPRKHGPEYQARARRATAAARDASAPPIDEPEAASSGSTEPPPPTHSTSSWWEATGGPATDPATSPGGTSSDADADADADDHEAQTGSAAAPEPAATDPAAPGGSTPGGWSWLEGDHPRPLGRVGRAAMGWVPVALAIGWLGGELRGCGGFSAACDPSAGGLVWLAQVATLAILWLVPRVASLAAIAAATVYVAAIPAVLVLSAPGPDGAGYAAPAALGALLVATWVAGLAIGIVRAVGRGSRPVS
jgi:hypothetical protein